MTRKRNKLHVFQTTFASFKKANPVLSVEQMKALALLEADQRMPDVWEKFGENATDALSKIMVCFQMANMVPQKSQMLEQISDKFLALKNAEALLRNHFSRFLPVTGINAPNHIIERGQRMLEVLNTLDYIRGFLSEQDLVYSESVRRYSPVSRKAADPVAAFTTMLCNQFEYDFGQPHHASVAMVADVIYQLTEDRQVSIEAVRMRHKRDREERAKLDLIPWHKAHDDS
ncbi:MAG: hypothetical protein B7Z77_05755 [Acidocella sp. 20-58-15]|nr:MAG: hypothetical protein B7Z77_05755 [Acidocella sp. 20-58-15]